MKSSYKYAGLKRLDLVLMLVIVVLGVLIFSAESSHAESITDHVKAFDVKANYSTAKISFNASITDYRIGRVVVFDNSNIFNASYIRYVADAKSKQSLSTSFSMRSHPTGYYYVGFEVLDASGKLVDIIFKNDTFYFDYISAKPNTSGSYAVYSKYMDFMKLTDPNLINYRLYMQYKRKGTKWKTYGPMTYAMQYKITKLKPNKKYRIRFFYGKDTSHGFVKGPYSKGKTILTGKAKKPAVRSIRVKAVKVRKKKIRRYGYYTGVYLGSYYIYTYNLKVTVRLKKKPGTKGIYINGRRLKGNKKTYTTTVKNLSAYTRPRGKKYKVMLYSYRNAGYGGYSPLYSKTKRVS